MGRRKIRWYWAAPATVSLITVWRDDGPWWAMGAVLGGILLTAFVIWKHRNDPPAPGHDYR